MPTPAQNSRGAQASIADRLTPSLPLRQGRGERTASIVLAGVGSDGTARLRAYGWAEPDPWSGKTIPAVRELS